MDLSCHILGQGETMIDKFSTVNMRIEIKNLKFYRHTRAYHTENIYFKRDLFFFNKRFRTQKSTYSLSSFLSACTSYLS